MQKARWTSAVAAAALLALPGAAFAQSTQSPPQNPPAQEQPPSPPSQPPSAQPAAGQVDAAAAKEHLSKARDTLSALTSMPEAAKIQGEARTQVSQLISNFNGLITTQAEWRSAYAKVDQNLVALLGPDAPPDQPVGTSGTAALDPAIRAKLTEFRSHLKAFESAAGGAAPAPGGMPPSAPTPTTSNPANPASSANPTNPPSSANPSNPPSSANPSNPPSSANPSNPSNPNADALKELDAISAILSASKTGALTKAQATELKKHVETLRVLLAQR